MSFPNRHIAATIFLIFFVGLLQGCLDEAPKIVPFTARVVDDSGVPVNGARLVLADDTVLAVTDESGRAEGEFDTDPAPDVLFIRSEGHANQVVRIQPDLEEYRFEITLRQRNPAVVVSNAENGFTLDGSDGARVEIPVNGLAYTDSSGNPIDVTGDVLVSITPVNPAQNGNGGFPGSFSGVELGTGNPTQIMSYGTAEFNMTLPDGTLVNLKPGATAWIEIPIYVATHPSGTPIQVGDAGQAAWYLNEETGIWRQESDSGVVVSSVSSPTGMALRVEVGHFSWWNFDIGFQSCIQDFRITGAPSNATYRIEGKTWSPGSMSYPVYGFIDLGSQTTGTLTLPVGGVPTSLEAFATNNSNQIWAWKREVTSCQAGVLDISLSPSPPKIISFGSHETPIFTGGGGSVSGTEFRAAWSVKGANQLTLSVLETGQIFDVTGLERFSIVENGIGPARRTLVLQATNGYGTVSKETVETSFGPTAAPEIVSFQLVRNTSGRWQITWDVRGADFIEWGWYLRASSPIVSLGSSTNATGQALLPSGVDNFIVQLQARNRYGMVYKSQVQGSIGTCDPVTELCN